MKKILISKILSAKIKIRMIDCGIDEAKAAMLAADGFAQVTVGEKHREFIAHRESIVQKAIDLFEKRSALCDEMIETVFELDRNHRLSANELAGVLSVSHLVVERRYDPATGLLGLIRSSTETVNGGLPVLLMSYLAWMSRNSKITVVA